MEKEFINDDFLGRGWSFPPAFQPELPGVVMTEKADDIERSLHILLTTTLGERLMEPRYGSSMEEFLFEPMSTTTKTLMKDMIQTAILYYEPRIDARDIELDDSQQLEGVILIKIDYIVRTTNSRLNFVFPYYRDEGTEVATDR